MTAEDHPDLPRWARDLKERIDARMTSVFVLHFNVADEVRFGDQFMLLPIFLGRWLANDERIVMYDRSRGLRFSDHDTEARFRRATGLTHEVEAVRRRALTALGEDVPGERELPSHPTKAFALLETVIRSG